jgi:hypothetical protein
MIPGFLLGKRNRVKGIDCLGSIYVPCVFSHDGALGARVMGGWMDPDAHEMHFSPL